MTEDRSTPWVARGPRPFTHRVMTIRQGEVVYQHHRAYQAVVIRRGPDGKQETERCPHNHQKMKAARKCGEAAARRFNREEKKNAKP